jgi:hypothetical protein
VVRDEAPGKPAWTTPLPLAATAPYVVMAESSAATFDAPREITHERYESIYRAGEFMHLFSTPSLSVALELTEQCRIGGALARTRIGCTGRDYGMFERETAPQVWRA